MRGRGLVKSKCRDIEEEAKKGDEFNKRGRERVMILIFRYKRNDQKCMGNKRAADGLLKRGYTFIQMEGKVTREGIDLKKKYEVHCFREEI